MSTKSGSAIAAECYHALFATAHDAMCVIELPAGHFVSVNDAMVGLYGYSREEFARLRVDEVSAEPSVSASVVGGLHAGDRLVVAERSHRKRDGHAFPVEVSAVAFEFEGRSLGAAVIRDVTRRVETEALLRRNEDRLDALLRYSRDVIAVLDPSGELSYISPSAPQLFGYSYGSHLGTSVLDLVHPDDRDRAIEALAARLRTSAPRQPLELRVAHADGTYHDIEIVGGNLTDNPSVRGVVLNIRDITDRKRAEAAARRSERRFEAMVASLSDLISVIDEHGTMSYVSPAKDRMLGRHDDRTGASIFEFVHPDDAVLARRKLAEVVGGTRRVAPFELRIEHDDGTYRHLEVVATNLLDDDDVRGIVVNSRDITDRVELEAARRAAEAELRRAEVEGARLAAEAERQRLEVQLARAQRLESLGRLTAGVAHDFNNILGVILNYASTAARRARHDEALAGDIACITDAATKASEITSRLLAFGKADAGRAEVVDVNAAVLSLHSLVGGTLGAAVRLEVELNSDGCHVSIDPTHLTQILLNLVLNAADIDVGATRITITTDVGRSDGIDVPGVTIRVADDGCGMTPDVARRAFEPFFTTKAHDRGSGLGLATVHTLVTHAHGTVELEAETGIGTVVTVRLPPAADPVRAGAGEQ